ncbi:MAG: ATP-binding protein [Clostridia bacterium]|nr:ATP-binding protein [Clostridia bacterium]
MNNEIRIKIAREFALKRDRALQQASRRRAELYENCPELREVDTQTAALSRAYLRHQLEGEGAMADYEQQMNDLEQRRAKLIAASGVDIAPHFECAKCEDTGRIGTEYCNCFMSRVIEENLANANLSITSTHERFETFDLGMYSAQVDPRLGFSVREHMGYVLDRCKLFVEEFDEGTKNLLLVGAPGLGKTFLSSAIAHSLLERGKTVIYLSATEFCARIQANKFGDQTMELLPYYGADLLILDDLGTEFRTQLTSSVLGEVIDRRLRSGKKIVFSTNLTLKELENNYSARIISRLLGGFDYVQFLGSDIRRKGD